MKENRIKSNRLNVRLTDKQKEILEAEAKKRFVPMTTLLWIAFEEYLKNNS